MVSISEVAELAGVSRAVVSRVLNQDVNLRINPATRARVIDAIAQLQYVPSHAARSLRMNLPSAITLAIPDASSNVFAEIIRGVEESARARNITVMLARSEQVLEQPDWLHRLAKEGRTDGLILQPPSELPASMISDLSELKIPFVLINSDVIDGHSSVVFDDAGGIKLAIDHLRKFGHKKIGFVGGYRFNESATRRRTAFSNCIKKANLELRKEWQTDLGFTGEEGRAAARLLLGLLDPPTSIVVANVNAALGFIAEAHAKGVDMPRDLSIIALHDVWYADAIWPPKKKKVPTATLR